MEIIQIKTAENLWVNYFQLSKNWIDLIGIGFTLMIAGTSQYYGNVCEYSWMPNLIYIMALISLTMTYTDLLHCIPNNDHVKVEQYMHMFYQVSIRYLTILAGFLPLFVAFAACLLGNRIHFFNM